MYDQLWEPLFHFGYQQLRKPEVVEGFIQEVFLDLWQRRAEVEIAVSIKAYLYAALRYKVMHYRKRMSIREAFLHVETVDQFSCNVEERLYFKELKRALKSALSLMPARQRQVYELRHEAGLSYKQIGEKLSISVSTVEKHLHTATCSIRESLRIGGKNYE
ncbi:sigma-70 family RNA polymerase sigma factor [Nitritalea halalkaliphila]|uniref:sigma-70 family RNA polymerase sigma factor n=1 Tax=Nitritalea halalkaliphila TaxID=590849 RepID=UPI0009FD1487|nr:sigma-70 family RNA polymerase sigma factor [Nitritalea halalkaliphila]